MDFRETAEKLLELVGGKENVISATHCATRLRLTLSDFSKVKEDDIKNMSGIVGTNTLGDQFQIIIGPNVSDVYKEFVDVAGINVAATTDNNNAKEETKEKLTVKGVVNKMLDTISACVTPLIPIITAAGLVKLIVAILGPTMLNILPETNDFMRLLTFVGNAGFYFFPFYVGYGAAKRFECSVPMALFLAGILLHPTLVSIVAEGKPFTVYGMPMTLVNYSSNFISILLSVWVMSYVEKMIIKYVPNSLRSLLYPLGITLIMLPLMLCVLGPLGSWLGQGIAATIAAMHATVGPVAIGVVCALWPLLVSTGMHQALIAIAMGNIATYGFDQSITVGGFLSSYPVIAIALVYILKAKKEDKTQAVTNFVTLAAGGISEPAIFGMLLKHKKTLAYLFAGGFAAGLYAGFTGVRTYLFGSANVLAALSFAGEYAPSLINGIIAAAIGFVVSFVLAWIFGIYSKDEKENG